MKLLACEIPVKEWHVYITLCTLSGYWKMVCSINGVNFKSNSLPAVSFFMPLFLSAQFFFSN